MAARTSLLTINAGSSSLKFAVFASPGADDAPVERTAAGTIDRIGQQGATFTATDLAPNEREQSALAAADTAAAVTAVVDWLERRSLATTIGAIGHRVVHGGPRFAAPLKLDAAVVAELRRMAPLDPEHLPAEIEWIEALQQRWPDRTAVACFDTTFHRDLPRQARLLPIPLRYAAAGVVRYGFHGLSYEYLLDELQRVAGPEAAHGRVILAHLGHGASMAAVRDGRSIDTTMAFTPAAGLPMSSRSGDLDPGLAAWFARTEDLSAAGFQELVNKHSGLLGLSETSADMRDLLEREATDRRAADAIAVFCYEAKKRIGAYAAALGGLDTLIFSGGIGTHSPEIRARISAGLEFLGIEIDPRRNAAGAALVSPPQGPVAVRVMQTDEELQIARHVRRCIALGR